MDREIFGSWVHSTSALAKYIINNINPRLEEGYKIMWEKIFYWMPWMQKRLLNVDSMKV